MSEVTNRDLYEAIGELRGEFTGAIQRLDDKFMALEAGRLTRLESRIRDFEVSQAQKDGKINQTQAVLSTKVLIIFGIANIILIGLTEAIFKGILR